MRQSSAAISQSRVPSAAISQSRVPLWKDNYSVEPGYYFPKDPFSVCPVRRSTLPRYICTVGTVKGTYATHYSYLRTSILLLNYVHTYLHTYLHQYIQYRYRIVHSLLVVCTWYGARAARENALTNDQKDKKSWGGFHFV